MVFCSFEQLVDLLRQKYDHVSEERLQLEVRVNEAEARAERALLEVEARLAELKKKSAEELASLRAELQSARDSETNLEIKVGGLSAKVGNLEADLASAKETVAVAEAAARADMERRVREQGAIFRAVAERVLFADSFSVVGGKLASVASSKIADVIFARVQRAIPDVDRSFLGYVPLSDKMFRQAYARILLNALTNSQVLRELSIDRDADLDPVLRRLKADEDFSSDTGEEGGEEEEEAQGSKDEKGPEEEGATVDVGNPFPPTNEGATRDDV